MANRASGFEDFQNAVRHRLRQASLRPARLRGRRLFSPQLAYGRHFGPPMPSARQASVMMVLEPRAGCWTLPLTVRPRHLPDHPGQICLPGGRLEAGESHLSAARREFLEEMGVLCPERVVGELLPLYVYHSNYYVRPFLAIAEQSLKYQPCPYEVERIVHLPLECLQDLRQCKLAPFRRDRMVWQARVIPFHSDQIWGATAILLGDLAVILENLPLPKLPVADRPDVAEST